MNKILFLTFLSFTTLSYAAEVMPWRTCKEDQSPDYPAILRATNLKAAIRIFESNGDLKAKAPESEETLLHCSMRENVEPAVTAFCLRNSFKPNGKTKFDQTPLHILADHLKDQPDDYIQEKISLLLAAGAKPELTGEKTRLGHPITPLESAQHNYTSKDMAEKLQLFEQCLKEKVKVKKHCTIS